MPQLQQLQSRFANSFDHTARRVEQPFYRQPGVHLRPLSGGFGVGRILATTWVDAGDNVGSGQAASSYGCLHIVARQNFDKRGLDEPDPVLIGLEVAELSSLIEAAMGWFGGHLHGFDIDGVLHQTRHLTGPAHRTGSEYKLQACDPIRRTLRRPCDNCRIPRSLRRLTPSPQPLGLWNQPQLERLVIEYTDHHNAHRLHRSLNQREPLGTEPLLAP